MLQKLGCRRDEVLHVSSSLRYDLIPAHDLRIPHKVYVNRGYEPSVPYYRYHEMPDLSGLPSLPGLTIFPTALSVTMIGQGLEITVDRRMAAGARGSPRGTPTKRGDR